MRTSVLSLWIAACALLASGSMLRADKISDVRATRHNLSVSGPGTVKATSESQVCVFCHTPHAATTGITPLWNRQLSNATYTPYTSSSLDANAIQGTLDQPGGSSKLCLSCHDGTLALGNVNVLNGQSAQAIALSGTGAGGTMPPGAAGEGSGFTRRLGVDLTNDHPISLTFNNVLVARDGELRSVDPSQRYPADGSVIGVRGSGVKPKLPLEPTGAAAAGQIQCATCHDPHLRETDANKGNQKFLRLNRFQEAAAGDAFDRNNDMICLGCHDKNQGSGIWAFSAHANNLVATQTYTAPAASAREFPAGLPVWKAGCLNCHDTHTVQGSRRLLREGTDSVTTPKSGGNPAIEETCYQCHTDGASAIVAPVTTLPNIRSDFLLPRHMPIRSIEQQTGTEVHDIGGGFSDGGLIDCSGPTNRCGKDFIESRTRLGVNAPANRHAECTDCHNPHRVVKFRSFIGSGGNVAGPPDAAGTHEHRDDATTIHSNIASGVLRGTWGVEPAYASASFDSLPGSYVVKRGDPGNSADTSAAAPYVTREYQVCLKCHSDYGYNDNNLYPVGNRPDLGSSPGGTPSGTNNVSQYTNQANEFQAPIAHRGEVSSVDSGAATAYATNNHRSWHPVIGATGRDLGVRGGSSAGNWNFPWRNAVGSQTMYCSDCHGSDVSSASSVVPDGGENGNPWGPHGSTNNFILKGTWSSTTGSPDPNTICFKCHDSSAYASKGERRTGFGTDKGDGHSLHADKIGKMRCNWCHAAVPHGWKNKALLVNLNDVGPEAGVPPGTQVRNNTTAGYTQGPYYLSAMLKIRSFATSGLWKENNCGSAGAPGNGKVGEDWMEDSTENCKNPP